MNQNSNINTSTITYTYDAAGNKLKKVTVDNTVSPSKTTKTLYIDGAVYENDELQFIAHEEGRVRKTAGGDFVFDYFIKDHLSNTRMILTEEQQQDIYPIASLEPSKIDIENDYYAIQVNDPNIVNRSAATGIPDYENNNGITNNPPDPAFEALNSTQLYKLNSAGSKTGLGITLKVMAGDRIDVFGKSYYFQNISGTGGNSSIPILDILDAFINTPLGLAGVHGINGNDINNPTGIVGIQSLITQQTNESNAAPLKPRAFINVIFFDENFKSYNYRLSMVGDNSVLKDHYSELQNITADKNGYVYIYCSNESPVDVFFDNLQVVHTRSSILEENHYYPYGLRIAAISSKAAGAMQNGYLYQGAFSEYDEESGYHEFFLRNYDAQIGRWTTTDPYEQFASPYLGMGNRPVSTIDVDGGWGWIANTVAGAVGGAVVGGLIAEASGGKFWEGATIGGIYGAGAGAAIAYGLNLNGIQDVHNDMAWNIVSNALLTSSINLTTKLLEGNGAKAAAISGLIGLGSGSLTAVIRGKKYQGEDPAQIRKDKIRQYKSIVIGNAVNGFFDRLSLSIIQDRKNPLLNAAFGLGEGLLSGVGTSIISRDVMSSYQQNLLSSALTATPGLSIRSAYISSVVLATAFTFSAAAGDLFEKFSPSVNRLISIGFGLSELYLFSRTRQITPLLERIDYPDYFERF